MDWFFLFVFSLWHIDQWSDSPENVVLNNGTRLEWTPCWFEVSWPKKLSKIVRCAHLWPTHQSTVIQLPVVIIKNRFRSWLHNRGPILYLSGGPGSPTGLDQDNIALWWVWLEVNNLSNDLVLFDQRGTGLSQPQLKCPEIIALNRRILNQSLNQKQAFSLGLSAVKQCYQRLHQAGIDLSSLYHDEQCQ